MKETDDKAMELWLRRHAQRDPRAFNGHGTVSEAPSVHLDADELNALAENALPQAARARYFSHLADCASCRKLATELAATAAGAVGEPAPGQTPRGSFWQMLAALFSVPVMRYGVPVLTILLLVVAGFVALRRGPGTEFVAQKNEGPALDQPARPSITSTPETAAQVAAQPKVRESGGQSGPTVPGREVTKDQSPAAAEKPAPSGYAGAANAQQPTFAPEPGTVQNQRDDFKNMPAAPPRPAGSEDRERVTLADKARADEGAAKRAEADQIKEEQISRRAADQAVPMKLGGLAAATKDKGGPRRSREQPETAGRSSGSATARSNETVRTRSVSGRRFRLEGNNWIDVAYDSSGTVITLTRGSEQYRKLVNDNPGLGAIVDELGSVIVVWNGQQYRIH